MVTYKKVSRRKMLVKKLKHKYRLVFFNDNTFEEVWHLRLSLFNVLAVVGATTIILVTIVVISIAFTSLREFIPGYPNEKFRRTIVKNAEMLDSLKEKIRIRDQYFENLNALISGVEPVPFDTTTPKNKDYKNIKFAKSEHDSLFRQRVEEEEKYNFLASKEMPKMENSISEMHFFPPVKGIISSGYNAELNHFGIDIICGTNEVVKATLGGIVIMSTWTLETGYVIQIQHDHNIISIYKHNANLLKKAGATVTAGEAIAIVGNSGELTTGPHLHFELWYNSKPINPQEYIVFN